MESIKGVEIKYNTKFLVKCLLRVSTPVHACMVGIVVGCIIPINITRINCK